MGKTEIENFLSYLASEKQVSASTQNLAFHAILFLYEKVLDLPLRNKIAPIRSRKKKRLPTVLSTNEVLKLFEYIPPSHQLMIHLMYGSGLRLLEVVRLRVLDLDFENNQLIVRNAKGDKDRTTFLPQSLHLEFEKHLIKLKKLHQQDLEEGFGRVYLPEALERKFPKAAWSFKWQYVFPSKSISVDPRTQIKRRHHLHESSLQKIVTHASSEAELKKRVSCHTLRHSFATHLLENGTNIRMVQELMGHEDVRTTQIYTHVMNKNLQNIKSPLEHLKIK